ncbi:hypothetical protein PO124_14870 [Bacillus licheniformis]|nr:hypothetical protein [Bacillus licheniformis]
MSYAEAAAIIGRAAGRDIRHVNVEVSALRTRYIKAGLSPDYAGFMSELDEKSRTAKKPHHGYSGTHHGKNRVHWLISLMNTPDAGVCFNSFLKLNGLFSSF